MRKECNVHRLDMVKRRSALLVVFTFGIKGESIFGGSK
jgi:hypothetical protein